MHVHHGEMSPDLEGLIQLQQLETAMEEARRSIAAHPARVQDAEARFEAARHALEEARQKLKLNQDARRALEKEAAVFQTRLSKFKDQLSEVKTNREYQAMQKEIEAAQGELRSAEDKVLERMVEADSLAAEVKQGETALAAQQKAVNAEKNTLGAELTSTEKALHDATAARRTLMARMEPRLLALFEHVMKARKGVAVCTAVDGHCSICHVRLRPQVFQEVRRNDSIIQCESCQRILYYVPPPQPVQPPSAATTS
jgi:hypothetical protein